MTPPSPLSRLHAALVAAGIPIDGVSLPASGPPVRIDFRPEATPAQRQQAAQIAAGWDARPRRALALASVLADLQSLPPAERSLLLAAMLAEFLRDHPDFAARFNINLPGDEVTP